MKISKLRFVFISLSVLAFIAYPFLVYLGLENGYVESVISFLVLVAIVRVILYKNSKSPLKNSVYIIMVTVVLIVFLSFIFKRYDFLLFYPVAVNSILCVIFILSLFSTPIIERFALMVHKKLDAKAKKYVFYVTVVWIAFFIVNGSVALYYAIYDLNMWTIWCGLLSYVAMAGLATVEYCIRKVVQKL